MVHKIENKQRADGVASPAIFLNSSSALFVFKGDKMFIDKDEKILHDFEEDQIYEMMQEAIQNVREAVRKKLLTVEEGKWILEHPEELERWHSDWSDHELQ